MDVQIQASCPLTLSFFERSSRNSIFCSTKLQAFKCILITAPTAHINEPTLRSKEPIHTWNGFFKYCSERRRTPGGQVALEYLWDKQEGTLQNAACVPKSYLVITVCLSGRISSKIFFIWGSNPISSILSASSITYISYWKSNTVIPDVLFTIIINSVSNGSHNRIHGIVRVGMGNASHINLLNRLTTA